MAKINMQMIANRMILCSSCGSRNKITNRACTSCGVIFKDTIVESQNGRRLGVVRRDESGAVIGFEKSGISWKKIGNFILWLYFLPIMLSIYAWKKKQLKWYIVAGVVWVIYLAVIIQYEVSKHGT